MLIIGIDPGANGGIAKLEDTGGKIATRWRASAISMPPSERSIADALWSYYAASQRQRVEIIAFLEQVQVMPAIRRVKTPTGETREEVNTGIVSTAKFMQGYGFLRGCLITIGIPVEDIRPQAWQKLLGCMTRGNKNVSKARAQQLFPQLNITHKIADSLLIAEAGRRLRMGLSAGALFEKRVLEPPVKRVHTTSF